MKLKQKPGVFLVAALAGMMLAGGVAQAQDMKFWRIGTGGAGGTYFPIGGLIEQTRMNWIRHCLATALNDARGQVSGFPALDSSALAQPAAMDCASFRSWRKFILIPPWNIGYRCHS